MTAPEMGIPQHQRYWLRNCHGFRVDGPSGHVGVVEDVLYGQNPAEPEALLLRAGFLHLRLEVVHIGTVRAIDPRRERITITEPAVE